MQSSLTDEEIEQLEAKRRKVSQESEFEVGISKFLLQLLKILCQFLLF